jgi:DNA polymerase IV
VGKVLNRKMTQRGLTQISQLQKMTLPKLTKDYGKMGNRLYYFSRGEDHRTITSEREAKSISSETTLNTDISEFNDVLKILWPLCEKVSVRLKKQNIAGKTINLKLKTIKFKTINRAITLNDPTQMADTIYEKAKILLKPECNGIEYRLIGIGVSKLMDAEFADLPELIDEQKNKKIKTEKAIDKIREKFGIDIINKGRKYT